MPLRCIAAPAQVEASNTYTLHVVQYQAPKRAQPMGSRGPAHTQDVTLESHKSLPGSPDKITELPCPTSCTASTLHGEPIEAYGKESTSQDCRPAQLTHTALAVQQQSCCNDTLPEAETHYTHPSCARAHEGGLSHGRLTHQQGSGPCWHRRALGAWHDSACTSAACTRCSRGTGGAL